MKIFSQFIRVGLLLSTAHNSSASWTRLIDFWIACPVANGNNFIINIVWIFFKNKPKWMSRYKCFICMPCISARRHSYAMCAVGLRRWKCIEPNKFSWTFSVGAKKRQIFIISNLIHIYLQFSIALFFFVFTCPVSSLATTHRNCCLFGRPYYMDFMI